MLDPRLVKQLIKHEGWRNRVYRDTVGIPTVGVGFNLKRLNARAILKKLGYNISDVLAGDAISDEAIMKMLYKDLISSIGETVDMFPDLAFYEEGRQFALVDMMFNLGFNRLSMFRKMRSAVFNNQWEKAAREAKDSKWFRQVRTRGPTIVNMLHTGKVDAN